MSGVGNKAYGVGAKKNLRGGDAGKGGAEVLRGLDIISSKKKIKKKKDSWFKS